MDTQFQLIPSQASTIAPQIDALFYFLTAMTAFFTIGIFLAILYFALRYRRRPGVKPEPVATNTQLEIAWTVIPLVICLFLFGWAAKLYVQMETPPRDAMEISVVGKQWMWKIQHPEGPREINSLHVPTGRPIQLTMTSQDVIHSFYVPAFRVKQDVLPDRYTQLWFTATQAGTFDLFCAEFCGTDHSRMGGRVIAMPPADYARWLHAHAGVGLAAQGAALFRQLGCSGCHDPQSGVHAPDLDNLYGHTVPLSDGSQVLADERYLHDSILLPKKQIAAGYAPIMPSFEGRIGEEDVLALVAYLKERGTQTETTDDHR
jgi:cytochrome c oxidase subunit II